MIPSAIRFMKLPRAASLCASVLFCAAVSSVALASSSVETHARISAPIDTTIRTTIAGSRSPQASPANDVGVLAPDTKLQGIEVVFTRSAAQKADLAALMAAQQNPASPLYHQWLNPDQFAARFGMADADIGKVQAWLQQQGFTLNGVSRSRDRILFSGTAAQVAATFGAPLHRYSTGKEVAYAPSADLTIPSALGGIVATVENLSSFRPRPHVILNKSAIQPRFTSGQSGNHFLTPGDVDTIYDVNAAYSSGYTGSNQSIAVVGQSLIENSDIANFQSAAGLPAKPPTMVLVPNSGTAAISSGDETESDLDVEYSGAIAKGATVFFVYTGDSSNYGVFNSLQYAVDEKIAPIISISYGECESSLGSSLYAELDASLEQAATQGQTVVAAAGDSGSTDCYEPPYDYSTALAVDFPASSEYVTGVGGTEFPTADVAAGNNTYFTAAGSSDVISSALSYIPEEAWNDDSTDGLASGGGGVSIFTPRPTWQTGVLGIPAGAYRLVPDISLDASSANAPYLFCSSDSTATGITGSCSSGFRDANNEYLTTAGGTSFAAPIFAGMLAILNQATNSIGQGVFNPTFYTLASNSVVYATAFHDTTSGGNYCPSYLCAAPATSDYATTTGYDLATGLGSIDLNNLIANVPATTTSPLIPTTTTLTAATLSPAAGVDDSITITVAPTTGTGVPTGTVTLTVDGVATAPITLINGQATYTFNSTETGEQIVKAVYSGDTTYAPSSSTISLNVGLNGFTLAVPNLTADLGASVTANVSITPVAGYSGSVNFVLASNMVLNDVCYAINNDNAVPVGATGVTTTVLTLYTSAAACAAAGQFKSSGIHYFKPGSGTHASLIAPATPSPSRSLPVGISLAGLLGLGLLSRRARRLRKLQSVLALALLAVVGFGLSGCGYSGTSYPINSSDPQPAGTYTLTLIGTDSVNPAITSSTSFTLTIQ